MAQRINQQFGQEITTTSSASAAQSNYRFGPELPKPCVHPLVTPAGVTLTGFEMSDHVWHRGLWFTIKFINGENFWEESAPFGVQNSVSQPTCELISSDSVRIRHSLRWTSEKTGPVIEEARSLTMKSPGADGMGIIDWATELHALADLTLDRTPFTTWGGYGGLTFRGSRELHRVSYSLPDGSVVPQILGDSHPWVILQASVDGGLDRKVSVGIVDHPSNPRSPTSWYCKSDTGYAFFCAAFLFHGSMDVKKGQTLRLRHRVAYRDGTWAEGEFAKLAAAFTE